MSIIMKHLSFILILFIISIKKSLCQSLSSSDTCGARAKPVSCGNAVVLRGQSHIGIPAACFQTVDAGPCSQDLVRIYYDSTTYSCKAFSYSGCGGNANRFVSVKNCYKLCHPYYRQRFIGLGADDVVNALNNNATSSNNGTGSGSGATAQAGKVSQSGNMDMEVVNFSGLNLNDTGNSSVPANAPLFNSTEEPAEVQVVHEFDTYMPSLQQSQQYFNPNSRNGFQQPYGYARNPNPNPYAYSNPNPYYPQQQQYYRKYY